MALRFVQPLGEEECRVYYSCVTKLRTWVPGPVYALMTKQALKQATSWVDVEAVKEWEVEKSRRTEQVGFQRIREQLRQRTGALKLPKLELPREPQGLKKWREGLMPHGDDEATRTIKVPSAETEEIEAAPGSGALTFTALAARRPTRDVPWRRAVNPRARRGLDGQHAVHADVGAARQRVEAMSSTSTASAALGASGPRWRAWLPHAHKI